jgi:hypothetical protein
MPVVLGVISDTHGVARPSALEALTGSEVIIYRRYWQAGGNGRPQLDCTRVSH